MASFKFVLRPSKRRADNTVPVYLRITEDRKSRFIATPVAVEEALWNASKQEVRRPHPQAAVYNDHLKRMRADAETKALDTKSARKQSLSAAALKKEIQGKGASQFFAYAQAYADRRHAEGRYWEWRKINVLITKLKAFSGQQHLPIGAIDHDFVAKFERYMREELKNRTNTVSKNLQILNRIVKQAVRDGLLHAGDNPFLNYTVKSEKTTKQKLSIENIRALEALVLPSGSWLELTRDTFLFSFYCAGVRFGDMCRLGEENLRDGRLHYQMAKTGVWKSVKLPEPARAILARYGGPEADPKGFLFPLLEAGTDAADPIAIRKRISSKNVIVNKNLKKIAELAGIKPHLSFHVSRHSYADYARRMGLDLYVISKSLGHSKLNITQVYLEELDQEALDGAMDQLFSPAPPARTQSRKAKPRSRKPAGAR